MSRYKLAHYAVDKVYGLLSGVTVAKYKHSAPLLSRPAEFVVVNGRIVRVGTLQIVAVNVNYHCRNLSGGVPDTSKLNSVSQSILDTIEQTNSEIYSDYDGNEIIPEPQHNEHISNMVFKVKILN